MIIRSRNGHDGRNGAAAQRTHGNRLWMLAAGLALLLLLALAGCDSGQSGPIGNGISQTPGSQGGTPGSATQAATATGPSYVQITDLGSFESKLSAAFSSNTWGKVVPFLSPQFSFQGLNSGGNRMVMPDSATDFSQLYKSGGPWSQSSQYEVNIHYCYAGNTPAHQQMGFDGGGGSFILVGIERWQGVWLIAWAFQDPNGGQDACAPPG